MIESWEVDHGFMAPLFKLDPEGAPSGWCRSSSIARRRRCRARAAATRSAAGSPTSIGRWDAGKRVAIIATGGLSHSVGSVQQGLIDVDFDRRFLEDFCAGRGDALAACSTPKSRATGSATGEIRSWIMLAGAFAGRTAEQVMYEPIKGFDTGCAQCLIQ